MGYQRRNVLNGQALQVTLSTTRVHAKPNTDSPFQGRHNSKVSSERLRHYHRSQHYSKSWNPTRLRQRSTDSYLGRI